MLGASQVAIHDHSDNSITIGHVADSTAALGSKHGDSWNGVALTRDHKPNLKDWSWWEVDRSLVLDAWTVPVPGRFPSNMTSNTLIHLVLAFQKLRHWHALKFLAQDEKLRIEKAGGRVVFDGYANYRVYAKNARYPGTGGCWSWKLFFFGSCCHFKLYLSRPPSPRPHLMWGLNMSRCLGDLLGHAECGMLGPQLERLDQPGELFILGAFEAQAFAWFQGLDTGLVNQPVHRNVCAQWKESQLFKPDPDFLWDLGDELKLEMTNCFCFC